MADATVDNNGLAASRHELVAPARAGGRRPNQGGGGGHRGDRDRVDRVRKAPKITCNAENEPGCCTVATNLQAVVRMMSQRSLLTDLF